MANRNKTAAPSGAVPLAHLRGLGFALALTALFLIGLSLVTAITGLTEKAASWIMAPASAVAVFIGSCQTGRRVGKAGWLNGGLTGLAYAVTLIILALLFDLPLSSRCFITLAAGFIIGAAGGVLGVNRR